MVMITTKYGDMDTSKLVLREQFVDNNHERTIVTEWYTVKGECVHRSARILFKDNVIGDAAVKAIFGL